MGIDAGIFAKKTKKGFWFDRLHNFHAYQDYHKYDIKNLSKQNVIDIVSKSIKCWEDEEGCDYRAEWGREILEFVELFQDEIFEIINDHEDYHSFDTRESYVMLEYENGKFTERL